MIVGLDVSKCTIDAVLLHNGVYQHLTISNDNQGFKKLLDCLKGKSAHICMEATGHYYESAAYCLSTYHTVSVVNPLKIKRYGESLLSRTKTDKQDAKLIADYCASAKPEAWQKPTFDEVRLSKLVSCQNQLVGQRTQSKNRLQTCDDDFLKSVHQSIIQAINEQLDAVKNEIKNLLRDSKVMGEKYARLKSIDGIGEASSAAILSYLQMHQFSSVKQYIAALGLCPREIQSGTSVRGKTRLTQYGHRVAKTAYFMPALIAYRYRAYPEFIERLESKGKPKKVIIVALMRKLATIAYYIYRNDVDFERSRYRC